MSLSFLRSLHPLNLGGLVTLFAVGLTLQWAPAVDLRFASGLLLAFVAAFIGHDLCAHRLPRIALILLLLQPLLALALIWLTPTVGTAQILLVIWTAVIASIWPPRIALAAVVVADVAAYLLLRAAGHSSPLTVMMLYAGFQSFAALCAHYARSAEAARDQLALVNADLLATRALLADSARDAERLRVARELHDVAGHKLTAMTLNLRALAADPAFAAREEVQLSRATGRRTAGATSATWCRRCAMHAGSTWRRRCAHWPRPCRARCCSCRIDDDVQVTDPRHRPKRSCAWCRKR